MAHHVQNPWRGCGLDGADPLPLAIVHDVARLHVHALLAEGVRNRDMVPPGGRLGHGLGVTLTEWPSFTPLDETPLRAGMVLTLEPGCHTRDGRIMVHEEIVVLREDEAELLLIRAPAGLSQITA